MARWPYKLKTDKASPPRTAALSEERRERRIKKGLCHTAERLLFIIRATANIWTSWCNKEWKSTAQGMRDGGGRQPNEGREVSMLHRAHPHPLQWTLAGNHDSLRALLFSWLLAQTRLQWSLPLILQQQCDLKIQRMATEAFHLHRDGQTDR